MVSKKSGALLLVVAMVFMVATLAPSSFVGARELNDIQSGAANGVAKSTQIPLSNILAAIEQTKSQNGLSVSSCSPITQNCASGCVCIPLSIFIGICAC